jgi:flavodoxin
MKKINLVYGTVNGEAEFVTREVAEQLTGDGVDYRLVECDELVGWVPPQDELLVVICSSTGYGDLPDEIYPWFLELQESAYLPDLEYGLVGLGDSSYEIFNGAIVQFEELFAGFGASAIKPTLKLDASINYAPEKDAKDWISSIVS